MTEMDVNQIEMVTVNDLVVENHPYRKLIASLNFEEIQEAVKMKQSLVGATGYGKSRLVMCLVLQFMED